MYNFLLINKLTNVVEFCFHTFIECDSNMYCALGVIWEVWILGGMGIKLEVVYI